MRFLIVEDNSEILSTIVSAVEAAGHQVVGKAQSVDHGLVLATECACDAAILDVDLNGQHSGCVAEQLQKRGVPFLVATGSRFELTPAHRSGPLLRKPFKIEKLVAMIGQLKPSLPKCEP